MKLVSPRRLYRNMFIEPGVQRKALANRVAELEHSNEILRCRASQMSMDMSERGLANFDVSSGTIYTEQQQDLDSLPDRMSVFMGMRNDATVSSLERILSLPIVSVDWTVEEGEGARGQKRACKFMAQNLFGGMSISWTDVMHHVMLACLYGFVPFEKVWEERKGLIALKKLAPKDPATTDRWEFDTTGGLRAWRQCGYKIQNDVSALTYSTIPIDKLLIFTYDGEFGNPEGRGLLRPGYRMWYIKDKLLTFAGVRMERHAVGVPVVTWEKDCHPTEEAIRRAHELASRIRTNEDAGIVMPEGGLLNNFALGEANVPFLDFIAYCDNSILKTALAQFINLGQGENTGAFALSRDQSSTFKLVLDSIVSWAAGVFNKYLIPQWYRYNWGETDVYPQLKCGPVGLRDVETFIKMINELYTPYLDVGRLPEVEKYACKLLGMPKPKSPAPPPREPVQEGGATSSGAPRQSGPQPGPSGKPLNSRPA